MRNRSYHTPVQIDDVRCDFHLLPDDVLGAIFSHLNGCDLARIEGTCRRWNSISTRSSSQLWKDVYRNQFRLLPDSAPAPADNCYWRVSFRHRWWKLAWIEIAQIRDRRQIRPLALPQSNLRFLRLVGVCALLTFVFGNVVMNLWNNRTLLGWHSFTLLTLWVVFCAGVLAAYRLDILGSWSRILLFAGCSSAFCSLLLFWLRALAGPAAVPVSFLLIPVTGCGLLGLGMIVVTLTFCRTPFVPASLRGPRSWLFD